MGQSGDPRKQERPDGREDPAAERVAHELTRAAPPTLTGMVTAFGAEAMPSRIFAGGKALELQIHCGPMVSRFRVDPAFADTLCDAIREAAREARSGLEPATMADIPRTLAVRA